MGVNHRGCRRFNPRAREGRDAVFMSAIRPLLVSIHAPARGATKNPTAAHTTGTGFQSTRPRGARRRGKKALTPSNSFQSTRPRGARRRDGHADARRDCRFQSTRPRGARPLPTRHPASHQQCFNPRAREGRDIDRQRHLCRRDVVSIHAPARGATQSISFLIIYAAFQSTRPRGARPISAKSI